MAPAIFYGPQAKAYLTAGRSRRQSRKKKGRYDVYNLNKNINENRKKLKARKKSDKKRMIIYVF